MKKVKVYLASQIFAECWRDYNEKIIKAIQEKFPQVDLYAPQLNKEINDKTKCATAEQITYGDFTSNLNHDDIVVAVVDGDTPGIGTTLEVGYFSRICEEEIKRFGSTKKKIISLYTDSRECSKTFLPAKNEMLKERAECQYSYINLLLVGALKRYGVLCATIDEVIEELGKALEVYEDNDYIGTRKNYAIDDCMDDDDLRRSICAELKQEKKKEKQESAEELLSKLLKEVPRDGRS